MIVNYLYSLHKISNIFNYHIPNWFQVNIYTRFPCSVFPRFSPVPPSPRFECVLHSALGREFSETAIRDESYHPWLGRPLLCKSDENVYSGGVSLSQFSAKLFCCLWMLRNYFMRSITERRDLDRQNCLIGVGASLGEWEINFKTQKIIFEELR